MCVHRKIASGNFYIAKSEKKVYILYTHLLLHYFPIFRILCLLFVHSTVDNLCLVVFKKHFEKIHDIGFGLRRYVVVFMITYFLFIFLDLKEVLKTKDLLRIFKDSSLHGDMFFTC